MALTVSKVIMRSAIISHLCFTTFSSVSHFLSLLHSTFNRNLTTMTTVLYCTISLGHMDDSSARTCEEQKSQQTDSLYLHSKNMCTDMIIEKSVPTAEHATLLGSGGHICHSEESV